MSLKERMPMLLEMRRAHLATLRANATNASKDSNGSASSSVKGSLRFIGVASYVVSRDVASFQEHLSECAKIRLELLNRHFQGEPIDDSYVSMISYQDLINALAADNFRIAENLAQMMGGRPEIEAKYDHPFDHCLGYVLKAFVQHNSLHMKEWLTKFTDLCQSHNNGDFLGYSEVLYGILDNHQQSVQKGLSAIAIKHVKQTKRGGNFEGFEDEVLCVWGIAFANLAKKRGLAVSGVPPLIPSELLSALCQKY